MKSLTNQPRSFFFCMQFGHCHLLIAHKLYPVRVRVVNDLSKEIRWMTVAYIPLVRTHVESNAKERSRLRRCGVLQRVLL